MVNNFGAIHPNPSSTAAEFAPAVTQFARNVNGTGELGNTLCEIGGTVGEKLARQANWVTHRANSAEMAVADGVRGTAWHRGRALARGDGWAVTLNDGFMFK